MDIVCLDRFIGLWQIDPESLPFLQYAYFAYKVFMLTNMYIFAATLFADILLNMDDISIVSDDGCIYFGIVVVIYKAMIFQIRHKDISRLLKKTFKCVDDLAEFSNPDYVKDIINSYALRNKVLFHGFSMLACFLVIALLFFSPIQNGLPIRATYPFNTTIPPWQQISLAIETFAVSGGALGIVAMDIIAVLQCSLITMGLDILGVNFENCKNETANNIDEGRGEHGVERNANRTRDTFKHRYRVCLQFHQRLVSATNDYNRTYSSSMFVQMLSSTLIICLTGYQAVVVGGQTSDIVKFGIYLSAATSQLFYICWAGNELYSSNSTLDRCQWLSEWHHEHLLDIVQMFTLSMMFTRRPLQVKAGVFYILSLETFITEFLNILVTVANIKNYKRKIEGGYDLEKKITQQNILHFETNDYVFSPFFVLAKIIKSAYSVFAMLNSTQLEDA